MTSPSASARPPLSLTFGSLLRADATVLSRSWRLLLFNIGLPIIVLVITSFELQGRSAGVDVVATLVGVSIAFGLMSSDVMGYPLGIARDRENGVFQRLRVTPAPTWTIMVSRLVLHLVVNIVLVVIVATIGAIVHGLPLGFMQYLLLIPVAIIAGAVFLSIGQALAGLLKSATLIGAVGRVVFLVLALVGLFGLTGALGPDFKTVAQWTPMGATVQPLHTALVDGGWTTADTNAILACLGYTVIFSLLGIRYFRWQTG